MVCVFQDCVSSGGGDSPEIFTRILISLKGGQTLKLPNTVCALCGQKKYWEFTDHLSVSSQHYSIAMNYSGLQLANKAIMQYPVWVKTIALRPSKIV